MAITTKETEYDIQWLQVKENPLFYGAKNSKEFQEALNQIEKKGHTILNAYYEKKGGPSMLLSAKNFDKLGKPSKLVEKVTLEKVE